MHKVYINDIEIVYSTTEIVIHYKIIGFVYKIQNNIL